MDEDFRQRLIRKRLVSQISLRALALITQVSYSTLARIERGDGDASPYVRSRVERWLDDGAWDIACQCVRCVCKTPEYWVSIEDRLTKIENDIKAMQQSLERSLRHVSLHEPIGGHA